MSGASGGIGSLAGQIARLAGARVIGSAGTDRKASWLVDELGFAASYNYRTEEPGEALARLAPDGIELQEWLRLGELRAPYTVLDGLDSAPQALAQILRPGSSHTGKMLVRLTGPGPS